MSEPEAIQTPPAPGPEALPPSPKLLYVLLIVWGVWIAGLLTLNATT